MLELIGAIFLGIVQGLTEFLPVSSSGHLLPVQYFLGLDQDRFGLSFDAAIHAGTALAVGRGRQPGARRGTVHRRRGRRA